MNNQSPPIGHPHSRSRRLRRSENIRDLVQENRLQKSDLIMPFFISEQGTTREEVPSLPGVFRIPLQEINAEIESCVEVGLRSFMLFPVVNPSKKDLLAKEAYNPNGIIQNCIKKIKDKFPDLVLFADVALDPYTTHGHDGITNAQGYVLNDETVEILCLQSLSYAACGIDFLCPSDMMDGRIGAIRTSLDKEGFIHTGILAHSAKFASAFYGPFRDALGSGVPGKKLDKKSYHLNPANTREALYRSLVDVQEGADMIMIKPALPYLDLVTKVKEKTNVPIAVYQVSGEYTMLKLAAQHNIIDEKAAVMETLVAMKRAGANIIVSYYSKWVCENLF